MECGGHCYNQVELVNQLLSLKGQEQLLAWLAQGKLQCRKDGSPGPMPTELAASYRSVVLTRQHLEQFLEAKYERRTDEKGVRRSDFYEDARSFLAKEPFQMEGKIEDKAIKQLMGEIDQRFVVNKKARTDEHDGPQWVFHGIKKKPWM